MPSRYEQDIKKAIQFIIVTSKLEKSFEFESLLEEVFLPTAEMSKSIFYTKFVQQLCKDFGLTSLK